MQAVLNEARELAREREAAAEQEALRQKALEQPSAAASPTTVAGPGRIWSDDERGRMQAALDKVRTVRGALEKVSPSATTSPSTSTREPGSNADPLSKAPWTAEFRDELLSAVAQLRQVRTTPNAAGFTTAAANTRQVESIDVPAPTSRIVEPIPLHPMNEAKSRAAASEVPSAPPVSASEAPDEPIDVVLHVAERQLEFALPPPPEPQPPRWYRRGEPVTVAGYLLPGLVSVAIRAHPSQSLHMSTIDASLEVRKGRGGGDVLRPDGSVEVKAYRDLLPASRDSYLRWLEGGCASYAPAHLVLLYMSALEARVVEAGPNGLEPHEGEQIQKMLGTLCARFRSLAPEVTQIEATLSQLLTVAGIPEKLYLRRLHQLVLQCPAPLLVRAALGQAAHDGVALPPAWAMQCVRAGLSNLHHSDDFLEVFTPLYFQEFPAGLPLKRVSTHGGVRFEYTTYFPYGDAGCKGVTAYVVGTVDVEVCEQDLIRLDQLYKRVNASLAVYDRYLRINRRAHGTPDAEVRLPLDFLLRKYHDQLQKVSGMKVSADGLAVTLWGELMSSRTSAPFLKALLNARPRVTEQTSSVQENHPGAKSGSELRVKRLELDHERIAQLQYETAQLDKMLGAVFSEGDVETMQVLEQSKAAVPVQDACYPGLDAEHTSLLVSILEREFWSRIELEGMASAHYLMLDGALEQLNEAALDTVGEVLLEDDGKLVVNPLVAQAIGEIFRQLTA